MKLADIRLAKPEDTLYVAELPVPVKFVGSKKFPGVLRYMEDRRFITLYDEYYLPHLAYKYYDGVYTIELF